MIDSVIVQFSKILNKRNEIDEKLRKIGLLSNHEKQKILINERYITECRYTIIYKNKIKYQYYCNCENNLIKKKKINYYIDYIEEKKDKSGIYLNL